MNDSSPALFQHRYYLQKKLYFLSL